MDARRAGAPATSGHHAAVGLEPERIDRRPDPATAAVPAAGAADRRPAVAAQEPVCPTEQGSPGHRPLQARQPVAHASGDPDQYSAGDAGFPGPGLVRPGLADRRPRAERQHGRGAAANGPGLAGVLHRLPDPRAGRRGRTAFPLGKTPGRIPPGLGPPTRAGGDGVGRGGGRRRTATGDAGR